MLVNFYVKKQLWKVHMSSESKNSNYMPEEVLRGRRMIKWLIVDSA